MLFFCFILPSIPYNWASSYSCASDYPFNLFVPLTFADCIQPAIIDKHGSPSQPISIDNCAIPSFSPSPSPSPPSYPVCAPVIIPKGSHSRGTKLLVGDAHQRSRNLLPPLSPSARKLGPSLRSSSGSPRYSGKLYPRSDQLSSFESSMQLYMMNDDAQQVCIFTGHRMYQMHVSMYRSRYAY